MMSLKFGGLTICLLVIGVSTGLGDETHSVRWRATFVPGHSAEEATTDKEQVVPINPGFSKPVSTGRYVVPVKTSNDDPVESEGILARCGRMISRVLEAFANFLSWVNSYPKGPLALALILMFLMHRIKGKPMP